MVNFARKSLINVFFVLALSVLIAVSFFAYNKFKTLLTINEWIVHTYTVISENDELLITIFKVNRLESDYFISGRNRSAAEIEDLLQTISPKVSHIRMLTSDNPKQQQLLDELEPLIKVFTSTLQNSLISDKKVAIGKNAIFASDFIKMLESIRDIIVKLNSNERALLKMRTEAASHVSHETMLTNFSFFLLSSIVLLVGFYVLYANEKRRAAYQTQISQMLEEKNRTILAANQLKTNFIENMSHELLTPLNGIIGFGELLHDEKIGPLSQEQKDSLGDILNSSRILFKLIHNILDLQQSDSDMLNFEPVPINLSIFVTEVCDEFKNLVTTKSIRLSIQVAPIFKNIIIDPVKLRRVISSYLTNAIKFSKEEATITLRVRPEEPEPNMLRVELEDDGIGIRKEDLNSLFEPFQQIDSGMRKRFQGAGVELALVRRIVEAQGGKVGVESTVNKGSVFYAILPYEVQATVVTSEKIKGAKNGI